MTQFEPTLLLRRLGVEKGGRPAYDERFHLGVNIVRGDNSSGKSTVLNFIYFALGGDLSEWSDEALLCDRVYAEVELNGNTVTLSREISSLSQQPMDIFAGDLSDALSSPTSEWLRYPYKRSARESFSQAMFRLMNVPEAAGDGTGNLTMNQFLRLLYADQLSPVGNLFKYEGRWDTPSIRDAVGRLLCGANETQIYENQIRLRTLNSEFDKIEAELKAVFTAFGHTGDSLTKEWVEFQKSQLINELAALISKIEVVEREQISSGDDRLTADAQDNAYKAVQKSLLDMGMAKSERDSLSLSIVDIERYTLSIRNRLRSLKESSMVSEVLGDLRFDTCPVCLEEVIHDSGTACHLCKTPMQPEKIKDRMVSFSNEASMQLRQSEEVLAKKRQDLAQAEQNLFSADVEWKRNSRLFEEIKSRPTTASQNRLRELHIQRGYLDRQIEDQDRLASVIDRVAKHSERKKEIQAEITGLETQIMSLEALQEKRLAVAYTAISDELRSLLMEDLRRQDTFENPEAVDFDFGANRISVDSHKYFSASSRVILKTSFFVAFLIAATKHSFFRHPRFCLIDTIEDKGMEQERSQNFQRLIVRRSEEAKVDHQIILATAMIAPALDVLTYTVGQHSKLDSPTLDIMTPSAASNISAPDDLF